MADLTTTSNSYGPRAPSEASGTYGPPKFELGCDRAAYKIALREWINMHKLIKDFDKKSKAVYVTAGYRILRELPEPVQNTLRQKQAAGEINYMSEDGATVVEEILQIIAKESQVVVNTRLSRAYKLVNETKRTGNQKTVEYAELFKGRAFRYLTMTHAPSSSVTSEQLAHLMISNANLTPDVHTSAILRLTAIVDSKKNAPMNTVQPASALIDMLNSATTAVFQIIDINRGTGETGEFDTLRATAKQIIAKLKLYPKDAPGEKGHIPRATISDAFCVLQDIPETSIPDQSTLCSMLTKQSMDVNGKRKPDYSQSARRNKALRRRADPLCYDCRDPNHKQGSLLCTGPSAVGREMQAKERARHGNLISAPSIAPPTIVDKAQNDRNPSMGFGYPGSRQ